MKKKSGFYFFFALPPIILNMVVLHFGQEPFMAFLVTPPLPFMLTSLPPEISRLALHLTQYP